MVSYIARVASKKDRTSGAPVIGRGNTDASRTTSLVKAAAKASSVGRLMISNQLCPGGRFRSDRRDDVGCGKRSCCAIAKSALAISNKPATILGARQFMSSSFVTFGRDLTRCVGCLSTTPADVDIDHCPSVRCVDMFLWPDCCCRCGHRCQDSVASAAGSKGSSSS